MISLNARLKPQAALGQVDYALTPASVKGKSFARSIYAVSDIEIGEKITYTNTRSIRPAGGLHPKYLDDIIGIRAGRKISRGEPIAFDLLEKK